MALEPWPVVGGPRSVFEHPHHPTILEEDVELPDGRVLQWLRYDTGLDGVMGICIEDGHVLLSRQYNPGAGRVAWEFPGGGTHVGEDYEDAVRRELMEEVGIRPATLRYLGRFLLLNRRTGFGIRTYLATDLERRSLPADDGEIIESTFVPIGNIEAMIRDGELDNAVVLSGWALLRAADGIERAD
jgi:ADP-ribose pyrophosphatase